MNAAPVKCPQCSQPIEAPVVRTIHDRGFNPLTRKQYARTRDVTFCSEKCGGHYQMGFEG